MLTLKISHAKPCITIVRIEFSPVVEIGTSKGHNLLQEHEIQYNQIILYSIKIKLLIFKN